MRSRSSKTAIVIGGVALWTQIFSCSHCRMLKPEAYGQLRAKENVILQIVTTDGNSIDARKYVVKNDTLFILPESHLLFHEKPSPLPLSQIQSIRVCETGTRKGLRDGLFFASGLALLAFVLAMYGAAHTGPPIS